eukprot:scaffold1023_cov313-Pinguiococcus_pyrenoidosus.AAC.1
MLTWARHALGSRRRLDQPGTPNHEVSLDSKLLKDGIRFSYPRHRRAAVEQNYIVDHIRIGVENYNSEAARIASSPLRASQTSVCVDEVYGILDPTRHYCHHHHHPTLLTKVLLISSPSVSRAHERVQLGPLLCLRKAGGASDDGLDGGVAVVVADVAGVLSRRRWENAEGQQAQKAA